VILFLINTFKSNKINSTKILTSTIKRLTRKSKIKLMILIEPAIKDSLKSRRKNRRCSTGKTKLKLRRRRGLQRSKSKRML